MGIDLRAKAALACACTLAVTGAAGCGSSGKTQATAGTPAVGTATTSGLGRLQPNPQLQAMLPDAIKSKGSITIATDPTEVPIEFYDKSHKLVGSDIDVANAVGQLLGLKVSWVPTQFDSIIPGLQSGRYNAAISLADRSDREKLVDFVVFFKTGRAFLAKAGSDPGVQDVQDLCGRDIALQAGTTMVEQVDAQSAKCAAAGKPKVRVHTFPDANSVILSVESGRSAFTMLPDIGAIGAVSQSNGRLHIVGNATGGNDNNGMALPKNSGLKQVVQKAIQQLADSGYLKRVFMKWNLNPAKMLLPSITINTPFEG